MQRDGIERLRHAKKYSGFFGSICTNLAWTGWMMGAGKLAGPDPREMAKSDCVVIWGTNAVHTQVNVMTHATRARKERGAKIVVVDIYDNATMKQADMGLIVKPGTDVFRGASLLALASAAFYATFQIMTRRMASEDAGVLLFYPALVGTLAMSVALAFSLDSIVAMPWTHVAMLVVGGMVGTLGHFLFILAFQRGAASALTPFTYVHLVWATLIGWLVFDTFPDGWSLAGMAIIAGSGLWITLHERWRGAADDARAGPVTVD